MLFFGGVYQRVYGLGVLGCSVGNRQGSDIVFSGCRFVSLFSSVSQVLGCVVS